MGSQLDGNNQARAPGAVGLGYDPGQDRWRRRPGLPLAFAECYPQGAAASWFVFAQLCSQHAVWTSGPDAGRGPVFLFAGAHAGPAGTGPGRLLAYNPG